MHDMVGDKTLTAIATVAHIHSVGISLSAAQLISGIAMAADNDPTSVSTPAVASAILTCAALRGAAAYVALYAVHQDNQSQFHFLCKLLLVPPDTASFLPLCNQATVEAQNDAFVENFAHRNFQPP